MKNDDARVETPPLFVALQYLIITSLRLPYRNCGKGPCA